MRIKNVTTAMLLKSWFRRSAAMTLLNMAMFLLGSSLSYSQSASLVSTQAVSPPTNAAEQKIRGARDAYFDDFGSGDHVKLEDQDPSAPVPIIVHHPGPKDELPADLSDIIVHGTIINSQAFQSGNHEAIYTETTVSIERVDSVAQGQAVP